MGCESFVGLDITFVLAFDPVLGSNWVFVHMSHIRAPHIAGLECENHRKSLDVNHLVESELTLTTASR